MTAVTRLERSLALRLPLPSGTEPGGAELLESYLSDPERVLMDLLQSRRLKPRECGQFRYVPRPIQVGGFRLEPRVRLQTHWQAPHLLIRLLSYSLPGLEKLEGRIRYSFQAEMIAAVDGLDLRASAGLEFSAAGIGALLPLPLLQFLGERLLIQILERLQLRCQRLLPPAIAAWAEQQHGGLIQAAPAESDAARSHPAGDSTAQDSAAQDSATLSTSSL